MAFCHCPASDTGLNIRMINQGSSELNIIVGVPTEQYEKAIQAIYAAFADSAFFYPDPEHLWDGSSLP